MTFSFSTSGQNNEVSSSVNTLSVSALNIPSGALVVMWAKHEGSSSETITMSSGTDGAPDGYGTQINHSTASLSGRFGYWLTHSSNASETITANFSGNVPYVRIAVMVFTHDGTAVYDTEATNQGSSSPCDSGNLTTTGSGSEVVLGGSGEYTVGSWNSGYPDINGVDYDNIETMAEWCSLWSRIVSSTFTGVAGGNISSSGRWICNAVAFKEVAAGGGTNAQINIGDAWKSIAGMQINIGDAWKTVAGMQVNIGDTWKTIF